MAKASAAPAAEPAKARARRQDKQQGTCWACPVCGNSVVVFVPVLSARCLRCGRRLVRVEQH